MNGAILDVLERVVDRPVEPLAPESRARIEATLRALHPSIVVSVPPRRSNRRVAVRAAAAALLLVATGATVWLSRAGDSTRPELVLTSAVETVVVLPDGTRIEGRSGLELPDGTIVIVDADGRARIGDTELAAGTTARIDDGQIVLLTPLDTVPSRPSPASTTRPTAASTPSSSVTVLDSPRERRDVAPAPTTPPTNAAPPTSRAPVVGPEPTTPSGPTTVPAIREPARLRATATPEGAKIRIEWGPFTDPARTGYAVVLTNDGSVPTYPPGPGATVAARTTDETFALVPGGNVVRVLVVAVAADDRILAASDVFSPQ